MSGHITVRAEMWTRDGEWQLLVHAPEWVVDDFAKHGSMSRTRRMHLHNWGGGQGSHSFLIGTMEMTARTRRERFARWLLRIPPQTRAAA